MRLCGNVCPWLACSTRHELVVSKKTAEPAHFTLQTLWGPRALCADSAWPALAWILKPNGRRTQRLQLRLELSARDPQVMVLFPLLFLPSLIFLLFDSNQTLEGYQRVNIPNHLYKLKSSISPLQRRPKGLAVSGVPALSFSSHYSLYLSGPHPLPSVQFNSPPPLLTNSHNSKQSKQSCTGSKDVWALGLADQHAPPFF